jgi:predicted Abi (CAAX) family protease
LIADRLTYFRTRPRAGHLRWLLPTLPVWAIATLAFGHFSGFLHARSDPYTLTTLAIYLIAYLFVPGVLEESLFRTVFLPTSLTLRRRRTYVLVAVSTFLFIIFHPLNSYFFFPDVYGVFSDWRFLTMVGLLGVYCSLTLVATKCVYYCVLIHYLLVICWKFVFWGHLAPPSA